MAKKQRISCWTVSDLARIIEAVESRHITARSVMDIVLQEFAPADVAARVNSMLSQPIWSQRDLYQGIVAVLKGLDGKLVDAPRSVSLIAGKLIERPGLENITQAVVQIALADLAGASQGFAHFNGEELIIYGDIDELARRVSSLAGDIPSFRGRGSFRDHQG
jgi:hypothetical protein